MFFRWFKSKASALDFSGGKLKKPQNPYPPKSVAWMSWLIGQLGGFPRWRVETRKKRPLCHDDTRAFFYHINATSVDWFKAY